MNNYGFLAGKQFELKGDCFTVQQVSELAGRHIVRAEAVIDGKATERDFPAERVLAHLVIEEEIELSTPSFMPV